MRQARDASIAGQSAQPTAAPKRRGLPCAGFAVTDAARAYLDAFSGDANGPRAPMALFKLGASLGKIGQAQDACLTLAEVNVRFPGNPAVGLAQSEMQLLGCQ